MRYLIILFLFMSSRILFGQVKFTIATEMNDVEMDNSEYYNHYLYYTNKMAFNYSRIGYSLLAGIIKNDTLGFQPIVSSYFVSIQSRKMGFLVGGDPFGSPAYDSKINSINLGLKQQWITALHKQWYLGLFTQEMYRVHTKIIGKPGLVAFGIYDWDDGLYMRKFDLYGGLIIGYGYKKKLKISAQVGKSAWKIFKPKLAPYSKLFYANLEVAYSFGQNKTKKLHH